MLCSHYEASYDSTNCTRQKSNMSRFVQAWCTFATAVHSSGWGSTQFYIYVLNYTWIWTLADTTAGNNWFKSIQSVNWFESIQQSESNRIPAEFNLSGRLHSWRQQCIPVGYKTVPNHCTKRLLTH